MKTVLILLMSITAQLSSASMKDKPLVSLEKAKKTVFERTMFFPVKINSEVDSKIKSDGEFIVIDRLVSLGQKVKKGTPLLILRNQDLSVHYEKRIIKSSVDGVVASIAVNKGQYINRGENLIHINNPDTLYGKIEVAAADYKKIREGLSGKIDVTSLNLKDIPVEVSGVGTAVDGLTGTISVELRIKDGQEKLVPGVIGLAKITLNKEARLLVKEKALYYIGEDVFLATLDKNKKVKKKKVKLGKRFKEKIEILEGLILDSEFIAESPKFLKDGEEVKTEKKVIK